MAKYTFDMKVTGYVKVSVDADSLEEASLKADEAMVNDVNLGELEDAVWDSEDLAPSNDGQEEDMER